MDASFHLPVSEAGERPGALSFETITDLAGFARLKDEWCGFFDRAAKPHQLFQGHGFLRIWARHYLEPGHRLNIIVARRGRQIVGILPLFLRRQAGIETLRLMGFPVAQFGDVLLDDQLQASELEVIRAQFAATGAAMLVAPKVRADAALIRVLPDNIHLSDRQLAPFADLEARVQDDGLGSAYTARMRSSHRRRLRRLKEAGTLRLRSLGPGKDARGLARRAVEMKREWLRDNAIWSPAVASNRFVRFFEDAASEKDRQSPLYVTALELDGDTVAIDLSFDCQRSSFGHVHALDSDHRQEGIGQVLVDAVFRSAKDRGNNRFELMAPADSHKMRHADGTVAVANYAAGLTSRGNLAARIYSMMRPLARRALRMMPAFIRRALAAH